jgi:hypothetical protein
MSMQLAFRLGTHVLPGALEAQVAPLDSYRSSRRIRNRADGQVWSRLTVQGARPPGKDGPVLGTSGNGRFEDQSGR